MMTSEMLPAGYRLIQGGIVSGEDVGSFGIRSNLMTESAFRMSEGQDRFVLFTHYWDAGVHYLKRIGDSSEELLGGPIVAQTIEHTPPHMDITRINVVTVDHVMVMGSTVLVALSLGRGVRQPTLEIGYLQAVGWCLRETERNKGRLRFHLPTEDQLELARAQGYQPRGVAKMIQKRWPREKFGIWTGCNPQFPDAPYAYIWEERVRSTMPWDSNAGNMHTAGFAPVVEIEDPNRISW